MTASADARAPLADMRMAQDVEYTSPSNPRGQPLLFKKRKLLPHPRPDGCATRRGPSGAGPRNDAPAAAVPQRKSRSQSPAPRPPPHALKHQPKRVGTGPDMPPTPPAHSRNSSSSHSEMPASPPLYADTPDTSTEDVQVRPKPSPPRTPKTPTNQRSPPTPDVTPPQLQVEKRSRPPVRPLVSDRIPSQTTTGSRTESFTTARETPYSSSSEEDGRSTVRPPVSSVRSSSQSTVRQVNGDTSKKKPRTIGLGLGLESSPASSQTTPSRSKDKFMTFDDYWGYKDDVEYRWDDNKERGAATMRREAGVDGHLGEVVEDNTVAPTNATEALRSMSLPERALAFPSPQGTPVRSRGAPSAGFMLERSPEIASRRLSIISSRSTATASTAVDTTPRRQRTLRHIKKVDALRDSGSDLSPSRSTTTSVQVDEGVRRRPLLNGTLSEARHASYASTATNNSISSRKARRDIWKNGGIPVVVVPERRSSINSTSRTPSLHSTRSSRRSHSLGSAPLLSQLPKSRDLTPYFDRPSRRGRAMSESDGSLPGDQRTMDYPPVVPRRTSSLSAPTSRNTSRAGSLTAESLKELNAFHTPAQAPPLRQRSRDSRRELPSRRSDGFMDTKSEVAPEARPKIRPAPPFETRPEGRAEPAPSARPIKSPREHPVHKVSVDHHGDPLFGTRVSAHHTPFSQHSVETNATSHAEVSEAMAVNIYPHQNKSVLVVDHSNKPSLGSESSSSMTKQAWPHESSSTQETPQPPSKLEIPTPTRPTIKTSDADLGTGPVTPPQLFSMDDVDSPLRNPRAPPAPPNRPGLPAIEFIPATPSGLTPAQEKEKQLGNFFDEMVERPPVRQNSLVRRALSLRQSSSHGPSPPRSSGLISRKFSLSRSSSLGRELTNKRATTAAGRGKVLAPEGLSDVTTDETKLHPFWRPAHAHDSGSESESDGEHGSGRCRHHHPRGGNRPPPPRRSLSQRMKRTFAILPIRDDYYDGLDGFPTGGPLDSPIRRTVRRSESGSLRVVKRRASVDSVRRTPPVRHDQTATRGTRPLTAPDGGERRNQMVRWKSNVEPVGGGDGRSPPRRRSLSIFGGSYTGLAGRFDGHGLHGLPRRLSERRREKRSRELRQKISLPREVRDGVNDVIRRSSYRDAGTQAQPEADVHH